jgi:hypothetical protein
MTNLFMAGFECSTQRRRDGVRLDLLAATEHDRFAAQDFRRCSALGVRRVRDGLRWHLIETAPRRYDWSSWAPMVEAADVAGVRVFWDLFHYGFPEFRNPLHPDFPEHFTSFALAAAEEHVRLTGRSIDFCAVNEISFFCWAVSDGYFPLTGDRQPGQLKRALVRSALSTCRAIADAGLGGEHIWAEPLINVAPLSAEPDVVARACGHTQAQFEAFDMLAGLTHPELGGAPELLGTVGLNLYPHNQWYDGAGTIPFGHHQYRAVSEMLIEVWQRYRRPLMISETGAEGSGRPAWLHYVCDEVRTAMSAGVPVHGICLYPVTAYPGWDNERHCEVGLFGPADALGRRSVFQPLAAEVARQAALFDALPAAKPSLEAVFAL